MVSILIKSLCEICGLIHTALIKKDKITFNILDNLYSDKEILDSNGYLVCLNCKHTNNLNIKKFL